MGFCVTFYNNVFGHDYKKRRAEKMEKIGWQKKWEEEGENNPFFRHYASVKTQEEEESKLSVPNWSISSHKSWTKSSSRREVLRPKKIRSPGENAGKKLLLFFTKNSWHQITGHGKKEEERTHRMLCDRHGKREIPWFFSSLLVIARAADEKSFFQSENRVIHK